jgi:pimeloyl-ACP methyl ester carboxylesterase
MSTKVEVAKAREVTLWDPPITTTVFEAGEGNPLLFLHSGSGMTSSDPFVAALADGHKVYSPVHPGFTDPDDLDELRDVHDLALYHDELLDTLGLDRVPVVGHSFGGMVAAELAAHVPNRVSKLVLIAPVGLWNDDHPATAFCTSYPFGMPEQLWRDPGSPEATEAMAAMARGDGEGGSDDPLTSMMLRVLPGLITLGKYLWPLPDKGLGRRLRRIKAPTLVVWGEGDKLVPSAYAGDFATGIPDARAEILDEAGHMLPYERGAEVSSLISSFVGKG